MSLKKYLTEAELAAVQPVTGDEFDISIRDLSNIETFVLEHTEGSITIALDETAIKMLEHCGCTFEEDEDENEEEQVDELAPLIGAIGRAVLPLAGRALGSLGGAALSGAGSLAGGALAGTGAAIGGAVKGAKNIAKGFDDEEDEDNFEPGSVGKQLALADKHSEEEKIDELAPLKALAGLGAKVAKANTTKAAGQVVKSVGKTLDKKIFGPKPNEGDYEYEEGLNAIRRLSGMEPKETVKEEGYDTSPGGPYDRGAADAYYGRASKPHKVVPYTGADGVKSQMQKVALTDPAEIAAYEAGYSEAEFGEKDYGESVSNTSSINESWYTTKKQPDGTHLVTKINDKRNPYKHKVGDVVSNGEHSSRMYASDGSAYTNESKVDEAEYQGRKVPLGKPMQGDVKKFKVYVKDPSTGNVKKVNFGDPNMRIKKSNPKNRKSFRARHNCKNPGPRTKARYWSCRKW